MYNRIGFQDIISFINSSRIKNFLPAILCVLFIYSPCSAEGVGTKTIINPLWDVRINFHPSFGTETKQKQGAFQSVQNIVSSYDEFELVLIRSMRERQSSITVYFNPSRSYSEVQQWNDSFWGTSSLPTPKESDLFNDVPWLIYDWTDLNWSWFFDGQNFVNKIIYEIAYDYDAVKEKELENGLLTTLQQIISPGMDIVTREKNIHDWIVNHVDYDIATLQGNDDLGYSDYSAFINGFAVCEGYSRLTSRMLFMAGIPNLIDIGNVTGSAGLHAWNMVKLDNDWYQLDVTWDDYGLYGDYTIYYDYYNITDDAMSADHTWDEAAYPHALQTFDVSKYQGIMNNQCSIFQPNLCNNEIDCIKIDGTWDNDSCTVDYNANPQCPVTQSCLQFKALNNGKQSDVFHENDEFTIKLNIDAQNSDPFEQVDFYIGIMCPDGTLLFLNSDPLNSLVVWSGGNIPLNMAYKQDIQQISQSFTLFDFAVPQGFKGDYKFYALFEEAGEPLDLSSLLSNLAYKEIIFNN